MRGAEERAAALQGQVEMAEAEAQSAIRALDRQDREELREQMQALRAQADAIEAGLAPIAVAEARLAELRARLAGVAVELLAATARHSAAIVEAERHRTPHREDLARLEAELAALPDEQPLLLVVRRLEVELAGARRTAGAAVLQEAAALAG